MAKQKAFGKIFNPIVNTILKSPLHSLMSEHSLVIRYTGRELGKENTFPAYYHQIENSIYVLVDRAEDWWRSLKNGANVQITFKGKEVRGWVEAVREESLRKQYFLGILDAIPELRTELGMPLSTEDQPDDEEIQTALQKFGLLQVDIMGTVA
jgi:hypothetical protein